MATIHDGGPPRKKVITYGKAARKRIPDYEGFNTIAHKSMEKESPSKQIAVAPISLPPQLAPSSHPKPVARRAKTPITQSSPKEDILDVPMTDDVAPKLVAKKLTTAPKVRVAQRKLASTIPGTKDVSSKNIFDVSDSDADSSKPIRKAEQLSKPHHKPKAITKAPTTKAASQKPSSPANIYDFPDDNEVPVKAIRNTAPPPKNIQKVKPVQQTSASKMVLAQSVVPPNIFDVPSSDQEAVPTKSLPKRPQQKSKSSDSATQSYSQNSVGNIDDGQRKKLKLSPVQEPLTRKPPSIPRSPRSRATMSPKPKPATNLLTKALPLRRQEPPQTPVKTSPEQILEETKLKRPSPFCNSVDPMDLDPKEPTHLFSPKGMKMWQDILDTTDISEGLASGINEMNTQVDRILKPASSSRIENKQTTSRGVSKLAQRTQRAPPRKRLIDSLVSQAEQDSSSSTESSEDDDSEPDSPVALNPTFNPLNASRSQSAAPESMNHVAIAPESQNSQVSQGMGPRFTYGRQRSMLAEQDIMKELAMELPTSQPIQPFGNRRNRRGSIPSLQPLPSFHEEDEDASTSQLKTVHELRKAGANNRFLYEAQDLIDGIGHPEKTSTSARRSGLVDLAGKLKEKEFMEQFRTHSMELKLFIHLGQEKDIVSGYLIISILVLVLAGNPMPHIIAHLRRQGITRLVIRLLECQLSITAICKERKTNMSKSAQSLVIEHHTDLLRLPIWEELQPQTLTPKTLALKSLELMVRQTRTAGDSGDIFSKELTTILFRILKDAPKAESWNLPRGPEAIDFNLALSTLELHSLTARTVRDESIWISDFLPIMADTLKAAYSQPSAIFGPSHLLITRMSTQITNHNSAASDIFARPGLIEVLGQALVAKFYEFSRFLIEEDFTKVLDHLVVLLGGLINLADNSKARDAFQSLQGSPNDPLDALVQVFLDYQAHSHKADNIQLAQKNIPFGWLSVMLGYFCLHPSIAARIKAKQPGNTLRPLMVSIEEFAMIHKNADEIMKDEEGYSPQTGVTERLEALVEMVKAVS